jgi:hypothetical protein
MPRIIKRPVGAGLKPASTRLQLRLRALKTLFSYKTQTTCLRDDVLECGGGKASPVDKSEEKTSPEVADGRKCNPTCSVIL